MNSDTETSLDDRARGGSPSVGRSAAGNESDTLITAAGVLVVMAVLYDLLRRSGEGT